MLDASLFGVANDQYNDIPVERMTVHSPVDCDCCNSSRYLYVFTTVHHSLVTAQEYNVRECDRPARYFRFHDKTGFHLRPLEQH